MISPCIIDAGGKKVVVRLMDDSWTFNECVSAHPFKPRHGVVWSHNQHCSRLPVPGDQLPDFIDRVRQAYGTCAVLAWHGEILLGHVVFLPKTLARERKATGWKRFGDTASDAGTIVVINLAMCSLSGHEFRRKGIGTALVEIMCQWAVENGWEQIEVYDTDGGLFPVDWLDHCIPPRPFWEKQGFVVFQKHGEGRFSKEYLEAVLKDNPRNSAAEQREEEELIEALHRGTVDQERYAYQYDLRLELL